MIDFSKLQGAIISSEDNTSSVFEIGGDGGTKNADAEIPELESLSTVKPGAKAQMNGDHYNYMKMVVQLTETKYLRVVS